MSKLPGTLGEYVTVGMAVELLGHKREQTGRFYSLVKKGLPTYKLGGMTLARFSELAEHAKLAASKPPWPEPLASLPMEHLHSRNGAAELLGVSPRTINRYASNGTVKSVSLSAWGGYTLYIIPSTKSMPTYMHIGDWTLELELTNKGRLNIVLRNPNVEWSHFEPSFGNQYPRMVFLANGHTSDKVVATIRMDLERDREWKKQQPKLL